MKTRSEFIKLLLLTVIASVVSSYSYSQSFSLGGKSWGIALGNPFVYSGIRINAIDLDDAHRINGINFCLYSKTCQTNGIQISAVSDANNDSDQGPNSNIFCSANGIKISVINKNGSHNGMQAGLFNYCLKYNGNGVLLGIVNVFMYNKGNDCFGYHNGFIAGLLNFGIVSRGVQIGMFNINTVSAVSIGLINYERSSWTQVGLINVVDENSGVQIGAVNIRKANIPFARLLPLLNMRWE